MNPLMLLFRVAVRFFFVFGVLRWKTDRVNVKRETLEGALAEAMKKLAVNKEYHSFPAFKQWGLKKCDAEGKVSKYLRFIAAVIRSCDV